MQLMNTNVREFGLGKIGPTVQLPVSSDEEKFLFIERVSWFGTDQSVIISKIKLKDTEMLLCYAACPLCIEHTI